jgi:putative ABC transport system permease protein
MSWWNFIFPKRPADPQLHSELHFHIEELTEANIAAGMPPEEARRRAIFEFGGPEQIKEELRDVHRILILDSTLANLRSSYRFIRKSPSFSLTVILTLALAIGANSAVFSAIDAILLRPLPFPNGDQLVRLDQINPRVKTSETFVAPVRLEDWNRMTSSFQAMTGYYTEDNSEISGNLPEKVTRAFVAPRFLQVWGISPAMGRDFTPEEAHFGGPTAVIISDRYWRHRFGADPGALDKKLRFDNGRACSIVGIMPASFFFPVRDVDIWTPVAIDAPFAQSRESTWYTVIGRLKSQTTVAQAQADLATTQAQLATLFPKSDKDLRVAIQPLKETTVGAVRGSLLLLFGSVSLLLLIACTNIVALLLARAARRQHEIAVRFSLGASRGALVIQLLTEAFVLALLGALLGLFLAGGTSSLFRALAHNLPRVEEIHLDTRIVIYSLACSVLVTLLCGLIPAIRGTRTNLSGSLAQVSRTQVSARNSLQWILVGFQVALAVTLLAGAGLLVRSFQQLGRVSPGFDPSHVLTFHISGSWGETADMKGLRQRIDRTIEALRALPGVEAVATAASLPGVPSEYQTEMKLLDGPSDPNRKILGDSRFVSPGYFATTRIPVLAGESCREQSNSLDVLVNRNFADTFLVGSPPLGRHLQMTPAANESSFALAGTIRGIVGDAREQGMNREPGPTVYWCISSPSPDPFYMLRASGKPLAMAEAVRSKIHEIEPARSVFEIMPLEDHLDDTLAENRLRTVLLTFFALTAVSLACIGLYGTLSYSVNQRQREVGLRMALGAYPAQITRHFLLQGLGVTLLGCVAGWLLAAAFARVLSGMLYGVSPTDVTTLSAVVCIVLMVAAAASLVPSFRASRVDPMEVLREE